MSDLTVFSPIERDEALTCLALSAGHTRVLKALLKEREIKVAPATIKQWAYNTEAERYSQIKEEVKAFRDNRIVDQIKSDALLAAEVAGESFEQLHKSLKRKEIETKDLSKTAKDATISAGIFAQRGEEMEGKPNVRVSVDFDGMIEEAKSLGLEWVDNEAEEIVEEAQVVEEEPMDKDFERIEDGSETPDSDTEDRRA